MVNNYNLFKSVYSVYLITIFKKTPGRNAANLKLSRSEEAEKRSGKFKVNSKRIGRGGNEGRGRAR
jgi:hypothetical protein